MKGKKTGGRVAGTPNKLTLDLKASLLPDVQASVKELVRLSKRAENEATRLRAIEIIFERVYGKVPQVLSGDSDNPLAVETSSPDLARIMAFILQKQKQAKA